MTDLADPAKAGSEIGAESAEDRAQDAMQRPVTAVSQATGLVGLVCTLAVLAVAIGSDIPLGSQTILLLCSGAVPMILWSLLVERVYRSPTSGLNLAAPRPRQETFATTKVKIAGLWATWAVLGLVYFSVGTYRDPDYDFVFALMTGLAPVILLISVPYVYFVDRAMREPHDALWHAGQMVLGRGGDPAMVAEHARAWAIKGFWLVLLGMALPYQVAFVTDVSLAEVFGDPARAAQWAIRLMYLVDVAFAVTGYIFTTRLLDAQIRSSNPYLAAWIFALICYPPFLLMGRGGPLDYRGETQWNDIFAGNLPVLALWGAALIVLNGIYVWATVAFGPRFSNLTNRGILTSGPYRLFKHPAYLAKNLNWWLASLPFLTAVNTLDAVRASLLLLVVNAIYFMRARTEEWHLMDDPDYRAYSAWIAERGVLPRLRRAVIGR